MLTPTDQKLIEVIEAASSIFVKDYHNNSAPHLYIFYILNSGHFGGRVTSKKMKTFLAQPGNLGQCGREAILHKSGPAQKVSKVISVLTS